MDFTPSSVILTVSASDPEGLLGVQADMALRSSGEGVVSAVVTSQVRRTDKGEICLSAVSALELRSQLAQAMDVWKPVTVKIGVLPNVETVCEVVKALRGSGIHHIIYQPLFTDEKGLWLVDKAVVRCVCDQLLPLVTLLVPRREEALRLWRQMKNMTNEEKPCLSEESSRGSFYYERIVKGAEKKKKVSVPPIVEKWLSNAELALLLSTHYGFACYVLDLPDTKKELSETAVGEGEPENLSREKKKKVEAGLSRVSLHIENVKEEKCPTSQADVLACKKELFYYRPVQTALAIHEKGRSGICMSPIAVSSLFATMTASATAQGMDVKRAVYKAKKQMADFIERRYYTSSSAAQPPVYPLTDGGNYE